MAQGGSIADGGRTDRGEARCGELGEIGSAGEIR